jgi:CHAT domain-containing protein
VALALSRFARRSPRPTDDAGWGLAVIDLLSGQLDASTLASRIETLETLVAADSGNASLRNDLAVAYFLRGDAWSAFLGLEQIERAWAADSTSPLIAFNRAVALDELHLSREAHAAWIAYARDHDEAEWSREAAGRLAAVEARLKPRLFDGNIAVLAAEARRDPQHARDHVLDSLLPEWAAAIERGDDARADSLCSSVALIAGGIVARSGDRSVAGLTRSCESRDRAVAEATTLYADGSARFRRGAFVEAGPILARAARQLRARQLESFAGWADVTRGFVDIYAGRFERADSTFEEIARGAASRNESALQARALWGLALSAGRRGINPVEHLSRAADLYGRLGEPLNRATMKGLIADFLFQLGRDEVALGDMREAYALFDARLDSRARTGPYITGGVALADLGLPAAAVAVLREALAETANSARPNERAETLLRLAAAEIAAGRETTARHHIRDALDGFAAIRDPLMLERHRMDAALTLASLEAPRAPDSAIARLTEVEAYYGRTGLQFNRGLPLARRGLLHLRRGDTASARADIESAVDAIEQQQVGDSDPIATRDRAATRREVFESLVALTVERGDTVRAFIASERARGNLTQRKPAVERGRVVLSYYALPDRLLLWITSAGGMRLVTIPVERAALSDSVGRVEVMVRRGEANEEWRAVSRTMFDLVVEPASRELAGASAVTIVPDAALGRLPFAALLDSSGAYLGQRAVITYAAATRDHHDAGFSAAAPVVVGPPTPDARAFPGLGALPGAMREVSAVREAYPGALVITDSAATREAVVRALSRATLFHFAGHARLVERMPSQSHLVLAPTPRGGVAGSVLSAEAIAHMNLSRLRLAILSSCGTTQARSRRDIGQAGLSEAFFAAGARAVISSRWVVEDEGTAELMELLHAGLAQGLAPATALSMAQAGVMRSGSIRRPLAVWAAFVYEEP